jgi:hypothetical protein
MMSKTAKNHQGAAVIYRASVIESGRVVRRFPRKRNLILDQGLDGIAVRSWSASFTYAAVGTGTTPTSRDSGAITFTRAGTTVTASAGFFSADDVGRLLKFDSGEEMYLTGYTDPQNMTASESGALAASEGTVWYVDDTSLAVETKRTNTYGTDGGDNGSTFSGGAGTYTLKRTFLFSEEVAPITYREIGWSHEAGAGANLFGRDLFAGVGISLTAGQLLKVEMELVITFSPASSAPWANVITGWSEDGDHGLEMADIALVNSAGAAGAGGSLDPSSARVWGLGEGTTVIQNLSDTVGGDPQPNIASKVLTKAAYTPGDFSLSESVKFGVTEGNSSAIRSLYVFQSGQPVASYRVLLDAAETKDSDHTLTINFALSWGRTLVN